MVAETYGCGSLKVLIIAYLNTPSMIPLSRYTYGATAVDVKVNCKFKNR